MSDSEDDFLSANEEDEEDGSTGKLETPLTNLSLKESISCIDEAAISEPVHPKVERSKDEGKSSLEKSAVQELQPKNSRINVEEKVEDFRGEVIEVDVTDENKTEDSQSKRPKMVKKEEKEMLKRPRKRLGERITPLKPLVGFGSDSKTVINSQPTPCDSIKGNLEKEKVELQKESESIQAESNWGSWGDWGSNLLSTAASLSYELTSTVGSALEVTTPPEDKEPKCIEAQLQPSSERHLSQSEQASTEEEHRDFGLDSGLKAFGSLMSGVSGVFEAASNTVLLGGLDTLEKIGKRTMDLIQEGDPGLQHKKSFLNLSKPNLSHVLRDAKERAVEEEEERLVGVTDDKDSMQLAWEDTEGHAHLGALSLISKQCSEKTSYLLRDLSPVWKQKLRESIDEITCRSSVADRYVDSSVVERELMNSSQDVKLPLPFNKLIMAWPSLRSSMDKLCIEIRGGLSGGDEYDAGSSILQDVATELCAFASLAVALVHKAAEVALITPAVDAVNVATQMQRLSGCVSSALEASADEVCESVSRSLPSSDVITNIYILVAQLNSHLESALSCLGTVLIHIQTKSAMDRL